MVPVLKFMLSLVPWREASVHWSDFFRTKPKPRQTAAFDDFWTIANGGRAALIGFQGAAVEEPGQAWTAGAAAPDSACFNRSLPMSRLPATPALADGAPFRAPGLCS